MVSVQQLSQARGRRPSLKPQTLIGVFALCFITQGLWLVSPNMARQEAEPIDKTQICTGIISKGCKDNRRYSLTLLLKKGQRSSVYIVRGWFLKLLIKYQGFCFYVQRFMIAPNIQRHARHFFPFSLKGKLLTKRNTKHKGNTQL